MHRLVGLSALALIPAVAWATTGLAWSWSEPQRFLIVARVSNPETVPMLAEMNKGFRSPEFQIELVTTCKVESELKAAWELRCDIDDVALLSKVVAADSDKIDPVLQELDQKLTDAWVQLQFTSDGRIRDLDLEDFEKGNARTEEIQETMRLVLLRAFATLDLPLPKKGDDKGRGTWRANGLHATNLMSDHGSMGSVQVDNQIASTEGSVVEIRTAGKGVVMSGETINVGGVEKPSTSWDMAYEGTARFDTVSGRLLERQYLVDGRPTASSYVAEGFAGQPYVQAARVVRLEQDAQPRLSETGVLVD